MPPEHPKRFEAMAQRFYLCRQVGISSLEEQLQQLQIMEHSAQAALQRSNVWFYRSMVKDDQQDLLGALEASQKAYAFALEVSPAEAFYPLIFVTHYQRDLGLLQEAAADGLKALELAEALSPFHKIEARLCHGLTLMLQDQPKEALAWIEEAEGLMNRHGPAPSSFWLLQERIGAVRARVYNYLGCYAPAVEQVRALIERSRQQKVQRQELIGLWIRAESWLGLGRLSQATEDLERCLELVRQLNWGGSKTHQLYAELELMQQNPKAALRFSERALEEAGMNRVQRINALYSRGGAWLALGERQRAREDLEQALNLHGHTARLHCVNSQFIQTRLKLTIQ
jgi:tetratricopeptide (TPR) repeat protein